MEQFIEVQQLLQKWTQSSRKTLSNGTELICHVPHIAPQAWLHILYAALDDNEIESLENELGQKIPSELKYFYEKYNGLNVFSDSLSIWGYRKSYERKGEGSIQPYSLVELNKERPTECPDSWLFFGSYSWDGSCVLFDTSKEDLKVYRCEDGTTKILSEWPNFSYWLLEEIKRLTNLFDEKGVEIDDNVPTTP